MRGLLGRIKARIFRLSRGHVTYAFLILVGVFLIAGATYELLSWEREDAQALSEYDSLRELFPDISEFLAQIADTPEPPDTEHQATAPGVTVVHVPEDYVPNGAYDYENGPDAEQPPEENPPPTPQPRQIQAPPDSFAGLSEINPDFIGWIYIQDVLSYPVVRGSDNSFYLNTTFRGSANPSGAIFMDYRNRQGFGEPVSTIYGHNMRNGTMFARLHRYLDPSFLANNRDITIITADGNVLRYRVFEARITRTMDMYCELETLDGGLIAEALQRAPEGSSGVIVLSTCTNNDDRDERLRVLAALVG